MKFFWINCEQHIERRATIERIFKEKNIENYRVDAFVPPNEQKTKANLERACTISHLLAMSKFLIETNDKYAIICEDDLTFEFEQFWTFTIDDIPNKAPKDFGIVQLACILQSIETKFKDMDLFFRYRSCKSSGTLSYLITRQAAGEIVKQMMHKSILPRADCFSSGLYMLCDMCSINEFSYTLKYPMFIYSDENDSTIGNSIPLHISSKKQQLQFLSKMHSIHCTEACSSRLN